MTGPLALCPVSLAEANAFVARHHRHHPRVPGHKFSLGAVKDSPAVHPTGQKWLWEHAA